MTPRKPRSTAGRWFDSFPPIDPPGWDDKDGICRRHWAPVAQIPDPAQRGVAERLAALELLAEFASHLRVQVAPLPVPARHFPALIRELGPVCCYLGDDRVYPVVASAIRRAARRPA